MRFVKPLIIVIVIILFSNLPLVRNFLSLYFDHNLYRYSNANGTMTFEQRKSRDLDMVKRYHQDCLIHSGKDKKLYRLFAKNPFAFWRWSRYFTDQRYLLPYKDWKDIKRVRDTEKPIICHADF